MADSTVKVNFIGDSSRLKRAVDESEGHLGRLASGIGDLAKKAAIGFAAAGVAAGVFAKSAISAASDLSETISKSNTIFGANAKAIDDWSKTASTRIGQSRKEALDAAATFGNLFVQLGVGTNKAAGLSTQMVELASDFASFHNAAPTDVIQAMTAAFRGEYDAVQKYVPTINAAAVEHKALEMTGKKTTKMLTDQDKALAVQALLYAGAGAAVGDFARTSDGLANKTRILKARFSDIQAEIGMKLLPVVTSLAGFFLDRLLPAMAAVSNWVEQHVLPGIKTLITGFRDPGAPWEQGSPFELGMARVGQVLRSVFEWMRDNVPPILAAVGGFIQEQVIPAIQALAGWVRDDLGPALSKMAASFREEIWPVLEQKVLPALAKLAQFIKDEVLPILGKIVVFIFAELIPAFFKIVNWIAEEGIPAIARFVEKVYEIVKPFIKVAADIVMTLAGITITLWGWITTVKDFVSDVIDVFTGIAEGIYAPFKWAFNEIAKLWNNTVGKLSFSIPGWVPGIGGNGWDVPDIPVLHSGGVFNSGRGQGLALLQDGERVLPVGSGGTTVIFELDGKVLARAMVNESNNSGGLPIRVRAA